MKQMANEDTDNILDEHLQKAKKKATAQSAKEDTSYAAKAMNKRMRDGSARALLQHAAQIKKAKKLAEKTEKAREKRGKATAGTPVGSTTRPKRKAANSAVNYQEEADEEEGYIEAFMVK